MAYPDFDLPDPLPPTPPPPSGVDHRTLYAAAATRKAVSADIDPKQTVAVRK